MLKEFAVDPVYQTTDDDTIYSLLHKRAQRDPQGAIAEWQSEPDRVWHTVSAQEMNDRVRAVARGLLGIGVKHGSMVVIYSATCYDWAIVDFACAAIGAITVPIYETDSAKQAASIVNDVNPVIAFAGDESHAHTLDSIRKDNPGLTYIFNFKTDGLNAVIDFGQSVTDDELEQAIGAVKADDVSTIVFTSGSTGKPKGAMLTSRNFTHIVYAGYDVLDEMLYQPSRLLLFLPLAHCFARYIQYTAIGAQGVVGYVPTARHLLADLRSFKPTYLLGVPRVFEKVYNAASQKAGAGFQGRLFAKAFRHFSQWSKGENGEQSHHTLGERISHSFYMATVGKSMRSALGPNLKYLACGGAPINADLAHFFNGMDGITFIQGYGMTETAAPCVVNFEDANEVGSVGRPGPGIAIRTLEDGEVEIKGPNVFKGYFKQPELTAEVMDPDGWLHSGDLGYIDDRGFLFITGRKKDIIITAGGKNISPAPMEDTINTCPIVSHSVVIGDGRPFVAALIALDEDMTRDWLKNQGMDARMSMDQIAANDAVRAFVQQYIDQANSSVSRAESVRKFAILPDDFNQADGTLTPSMKVVRNKVLTHYDDIVEHVIYTPKGPSAPIPATVKLFDRTAETVSQVSETVSPKVRQALDQAKLNVAELRAKRQSEDEGPAGQSNDGQHEEQQTEEK
ncbi:AMP-dependent synthetase/ligase [Bifidobacterium thermophilum]|uniref:AMP-dependent synthetase/ligase n=1 Tax=Bifidobacterium thermophilum TaxID=33905 RepID=UPI00309FACA4